MAKQSWSTRQKTKSTKAINKAGRDLTGWLAGLIIFLLFFYITIPYRAIFKKDVPTFWKYTYKVITSIFSILMIFSFTSFEINEVDENEKNVMYFAIIFFILLAIAPWFFLIKKNKPAEENSDTTVSIKADIDEVSEGNFVAVITNTPIELSAELLEQFKDKLTEELRNDGEFVSNIEIKYNKAKRKRTISQDVKDRVWNRDGGKCVQCGSNENLEFDHIIPFSKGGANTYRNIQLLCQPCNRSKSDSIG